MLLKFTEAIKKLRLLKTFWPKMISVKLAVLVAVVLVIGALGYFYKGTFIAASVNGRLISRMAVIKELEDKSGEKALTSLITERLVKEEISKNKIIISDDEINQEIKNIEEQVSVQGQTLDALLTEQGMTRADLIKQITTQKKIEKILADKILVTDEEVDKYINDNKIKIPKGQELELKSQIGNQLKQGKFQQEVTSWVDGLRSQAEIKFYRKY